MVVNHGNPVLDLELSRWFMEQLKLETDGRGVLNGRSSLKAARGVLKWQPPWNSPQAQAIYGQFPGCIWGARPILKSLKQQRPRFAAASTTWSRGWICLHLWRWRHSMFCKDSWKLLEESRCRMGKNRCVIWKELTWLELICRRLACNFCGIRWGTVVQTVDHCCRWHATIHPRKTRPTEPCPVSEWTIFLSCKVHLHDPCWLVAKDVETTGRGRYVLCRLLAARCGWMGSLAWNDAFWMEDDGRNPSISNLIRS